MELKSLEEESIRAEKNIKDQSDSLKTIEIDTDREKSIVIDSDSNKRRLKEEKKEWVDFETKYFEIEKKSHEELQSATNNLNSEQLLIVLRITMLISSKIIMNWLMLLTVMLLGI